MQELLQCLGESVLYQELLQCLGEIVLYARTAAVSW